VNRVVLSWGVVVAAITVAVVSTASSAANSAASSGTLTELVSTFGNAQFFPRSANEGPAGEDHLVLASLLTDKNGKLGPGIAQSWTESKNATVWTFSIRPGVKFQNNQPVTAADVAYSLEDTFGPAAVKDPNSLASALRTSEP
jgi:peptide/nickel transport system substrate-binding protein